MAVNYPTTLKNTRLTDVLNAIGASGKLEIGTAGMASVLVTINLANPAGSVGGGILTLTTPRSGTAGNTGTAAAARIRDGANNDVITGLTVGTVGTDIVLNSVNISAGQTITLNSGTVTHG